MCPAHPPDGRITVGGTTLYTTERLAEVLGVGEGAIRGLLKRGELYGSLILGRYMFSERDVEVYLFRKLAEGRRKAVPQASKASRAD